MNSAAEVRIAVVRKPAAKRSGRSSVGSFNRGQKTYLVDAAVFEQMQQRLTVLEGIALGEQDVRDGRLLTQAEAKRRMSRWLK